MPIALIEVVLVFGGVLLFGWWQLRELRQEKAAADLKQAVRKQTPAGDVADTH